MKIALLSNYNEYCGIASYARDLLKYHGQGIEYIPVQWGDLLPQDYDVLHVNFYHGLGHQLDSYSYIEKPIILTNHATNYWNNSFNKCRFIVTHELARIYHANNVVIPMGIPEQSFSWEVPEKFVLSQAGFAFPWKNYPAICAASAQLTATGHKNEVKLFMPDTNNSNVYEEILKCQSQGAESVTFESSWISTDKLIYLLHKEASVLVWYTGGSNGGNSSEGPSASVRMALAARRPVVVNAHASQYNGILDAEGVYPVYRDDDLVETILKAHNEQKWARSLILKESFYQTCREYRELYERCA